MPDTKALIKKGVEVKKKKAEKKNKAQKKAKKKIQIINTRGLVIINS